MDRSSGNVLQVYVKLIINLFLILDKIINKMNLHLEKSRGAEKISVLDSAGFMSMCFFLIFHYGKRVGSINCSVINGIAKKGSRNYNGMNTFRTCLE
jgi:hypothetical protein